MRVHVQARPKKRRRRRKDDNEYDVGDPFIDDSTAGIDAPEFQGVPLQEGFFVHVGAVKLKEVEAYVRLLTRSLPCPMSLTAVLM